jgi:hypothetical protein
MNVGKGRGLRDAGRGKHWSAGTPTSGTRKTQTPGPLPGATGAATPMLGGGTPLPLPRTPRNPRNPGPAGAGTPLAPPPRMGGSA